MARPVPAQNLATSEDQTELGPLVARRHVQDLLSKFRLPGLPTLGQRLRSTRWRLSFPRTSSCRTQAVVDTTAGSQTGSENRSVNQRGSDFSIGRAGSHPNREDESTFPVRGESCQVFATRPRPRAKSRPALSATFADVAYDNFEESVGIRLIRTWFHALHIRFGRFVKDGSSVRAAILRRELLVFEGVRAEGTALFRPHSLEFCLGPDTEVAAFTAFFRQRRGFACWECTFAACSRFFRRWGFGGSSRHRDRPGR